MNLMVFFFQAEDGIRYLVRSRGLGDVYKRQVPEKHFEDEDVDVEERDERNQYVGNRGHQGCSGGCLLYTSDAADERSSVDLGGRRIIKKKKRARTEGRQTRKKK